MVSRKGWAALGVAFGLSACGGMGKSAEERIGDAMPPGSEVLAAKARLDALGRQQGVDLRTIETEYQARLTNRVVDCAHGYRPSMFSSSERIRTALTDKDCFTRTDAALHDWIMYRRIGALLSAPPLRPLPKTTPAMIVAADRIQGATFAERAGVAVFELSRRFQVVDIASRATISEGETDGSPPVSVSPNGRLFVAGQGSDAQVRDAATGEALATFTGVRPYQFHWVHDTGAIFWPRRPAEDGGRTRMEPVYLDFTSGRETRIPMTGMEVDRVVPVPGQAARFAVFLNNRVGTVQLRQAAQGWDAQLLSESVLSTNGWDRGAALTADGRTFFGTRESLQLVSLDAMLSRTVTLKPLRLVAAVATPDPDQVLVRGFFEGAPDMGYEDYVYSIGQRTLAKVERDRQQSGWIIYIPALQRNAVVDGSRIALLERLPVALAADVDPYLEQRAQELADMVKARRNVMLGATQQAPN
ncbi:hypothetical protein [Lysobacter niastensis]|uniref:Lipoprotein n=1 Tax=Lysobacter niastensis TaxID=380629 RepID=A0ABS0B8X8_9GAMM|nr:hypothetical protein [Lysobacter niastensis]MBF6025373.1 hypothetical protein [Lysobacter niastensis]